MSLSPTSRKWARRAAPLAALMIVAACRGGLAPIEVTRFHLNQPITRGSIVVVPNDPSLATNIEFRTYQRTVEQELGNIGFGAPVGGAPSEFVATMIYGQTQQSSAAPTTQATVGFGFGGFNSGSVGAGANVAVPVGRRDNLVAVNALSMQIKRRATMSPIWEGRASTSAPAGSPQAALSATIQPLSRALLKQFPGVSGMTVRVPQ